MQRKEQATVPDSGEARSGEDSLDWSAKVELFERIRREYEFGIGTAVLEDAGRRGNSATWRIGSGSGFDRRCRIEDQRTDSAAIRARFESSRWV